MPKRSASKPPPDLVFFTDADFGPTEGCDVVRILRAAGLTVEPHHVHFPPRRGKKPTPDHIWLAECARRGWIAVSKDDEIRYSPLAKKVIMENGVQLFVCIGRRRSHPDLAQNFVNSLPRIRSLLRRQHEPFIARIYMAKDDDFVAGKSGDVKPWKTRSEWLAERGT